MIMNKLFPVVVFTFLFISSCKENNPEAIPPVPTGTVKTTINPSGGSFTSSDKNMNVTIPANAVSSPVAIEVTELNNDLPNGIGKIYSLTNQEFLKPVTLTLAYNDADLNTKKTYSALLQLLTRKSATDAWEVVKDFTINT